MNELGLMNVGGIFLVLLIGIVLGVVMAAAEKLWDNYHNKEPSAQSITYQ